MRVADAVRSTHRHWGCGEVNASPLHPHSPFCGYGTTLRALRAFWTIFAVAVQKDVHIYTVKVTFSKISLKKNTVLSSLRHCENKRLACTRAQFHVSKVWKTMIFSKSENMHFEPLACTRARFSLFFKESHRKIINRRDVQIKRMSRAKCKYFQKCIKKLSIFRPSLEGKNY